MNGYYRLRNLVFGGMIALGVLAFLIICGVLILNGYANLMEYQSRAIHELTNPPAAGAPVR